MPVRQYYGRLRKRYIAEQVVTRQRRRVLDPGLAPAGGGSTITEDTANQPVPLVWTGAWTSAQTTAAFTPQAGTLLVALVAGNGSAGGPSTGTVTDSTAGTWLLLKRSNSIALGNGGTAEVWIRYLSSAPGSMTVSVTGTGSTASGGQLVVRSLLGANPTQAGATGGIDNTGTAGIQANITPGAAGNLVYGAGMNTAASTVPTALANTTSISAFSDSLNVANWDAFESAAATTASLTAYGYSAPSGASVHVALAEIQAAPVITAPWVGASQIATSGATSTTLDFTAAPVGSLMYAAVGLSDSQVALPTAPAGWTILSQGAEGPTGAASSCLTVYTRTKQSGDTTQAFTWGTACGFAAWPFAYSGAGSVEGVVYNAHSSGTTYPTGSVTPTAADRWIVGVFYDRNTTGTGDFTPDAALVERADVVSAANPFSILEIADTNGAVTAAAHSYTGTSITSSHGGVVAWALIPAGAGPVTNPKAVAGSITPTGTLTRTVGKALAGTTTPTGSVSRQAQKPLAGTAAPGGTLTRRAGKPLAGTSTPGGALSRQVGKAMSGSVGPSGALALTKVILRSFAGSTTPAGALTRLVGKAVAGSATPAGALVRLVGKILSGASTPAGVLTVPVKFENTAEGGTNGVAATNANTGGASGTAITRVVLGTSGAISFDSSWAAHGLLSYLIVPTAAGGSSCYHGEDTTVSVPSIAIRVAGFGPSDTLPSAATQFIRLMSTSDASGTGSPAGNLFINANGSWGIQNQAGTTVFSAPSGTLVAGTEYWFSYYWAVGAGTGQARAAVYPKGSTTAISDSGLLTGQSNGAANVVAFRIGKGSASGTWTQLHVDDLAWVENATGLVGPATGGTTTPVAFAGSATPAGSVVRSTQKPLAGSTGPVGALIRTGRKLLAGTVSPAGAVAVSRTVLRALAGATTPAGAVTKQLARALAGSTQPAGATTKQVGKPLAGSAGPSGTVALLKAIVRAFAGSTGPAGALTRRTSKSAAGTAVPAGSLTRLTAKALAGSVTGTGSLALIRAILRSFAGSTTPTGAITRQAQKTLTAATAPTGAVTQAIARAKALAGSLTPAGSLTKRTSKTYAGSGTPTGALALLKVAVRAFAGTVGPSGSLVRLVAKPLSGAGTPTGTAVKLVTKSTSGSVTPAGVAALIRAFLRSFVGTSTPAGALTRRVSKGFAGSEAPTGTLAKLLTKAVSGSVGLSGALQAARFVTRAFAGSTTPTGSVSRQVRKTLAGALSPFGALTKRLSRALAGLTTPGGSLDTLFVPPGVPPVTQPAVVVLVAPPGPAVVTVAAPAPAATALVAPAGRLSLSLTAPLLSTVGLPTPTRGVVDLMPPYDVVDG